MIVPINKIKFEKALVEVDAILDELSMEEYNKIPDDVIFYIDETKDKNYSWEYDYTQEFENQNFSEYTLEILSYINGEYLLNTEQKKLLEEFYELNDKKEKLLSDNFETNINREQINIFENKQVKSKIEQEVEIINKDSKQQVLPMVVNKKNNIFIRIVSSIMNFFKNK